MDINKNYYQTLEVDKKASAEDIKKQYRALSKVHHPDVGGDAEKFKEINEAYSILSEQKERDRYDVSSPHGANYSPSRGFSSGFGGFPGGFGNFGGFDINGMSADEIIEMMMFGQRRRQDFVEFLDIELNVVVNLKDIYNNTPIEVKYNRKMHCETCTGTGFDPTSATENCELCNGTGYDNYRVTCKYCHGKGKINLGTCKTCNGEKVLPKEVAFSLNNVYQIDSSTTQYLRGYGHQSKYYPNKRGNVVLNVIFDNDTRYERTNQGLLFNLNVHYQDAIDGFDYIHDHLDGKKLKIKIPIETKDKDIIRIREKGLLTTATTRSNLLMRINIVIDYDRVKRKRETKPKSS